MAWRLLTDSQHVRAYGTGDPSYTSERDVTTLLEGTTLGVGKRKNGDGGRWDRRRVLREEPT